MAQTGNMANLEARLTTLGCQVEQLAQMLDRVPRVSLEISSLYGWQDELSDFTAKIKQTSTELSSFRERWHDATIVKSEDVTRLERREEEIKMKEELLEQEAAEITKREKLLEQRTADITMGQELLEQKAAEMTKREELSEQMTAEMTKREALLEQMTAEMTKRGELLERRAAEISKGEELSEQKTIAINDKEALIQRRGVDLQESIKIHVDSQTGMAKEVETLTTREAQVTDAENALETRSETIRRREDNLKHARESLEHHQQIVVQLHQSTKEKLDSIREERADGKRQNAEMIRHNINTNNQLKADAAKVQGLIKNFQKLKSSIATPLQKCEAAIADMKGEAQSLNVFEAEQREEIASLNNELARISTSTDKHRTAIKSISEDLQAIDTNHTRLMSRQFDEISAKLANVSEVTSGLDAISTKFREMQVAEPNATESMNGAAEELRNATETGSKAREALQKVLARQNASSFNDKSAKRGPLLSSPEKPAPKRRQARGGSAGAAEVLANVESNELLANTTQTFGSPGRRRRPLTPFTGQMTASRSGVSSPALNPTPATRQDLIVNPSPDTLVPQGQGVDLATNPSGLSMASDHVQDVWRQIEFPADWTTADSDQLLAKLNEAKERKPGKNNRYWPQQAMDMGSKSTQPYCLLKDLKRAGMLAPQDDRRCESHASDDLCINVFYTTDNPGEYNSAATDKRWRLIKRE